VKAWFLRFSVREQVALLVMGFAVAAYILVMLLVLPLGEARATLAERNVAAAESLVRVDGLSSELRALRESGADSRRSDGRNLTAVVNASAERFGLRPSRLQPNSRGAVQVRFEAAGVESLLRWLHDLESAQGLMVEELSMTQSATAGIVSATTRIAPLP
jgi:type II secretory pathway component PulM